MKAIRIENFGLPEVMKLEEVQDFVVGPGQVVVRVKAVGVNPVDTYIRAGTYSPRHKLPYTPGMDAAGEVLTVGEGVFNFSVGKRVYVAGSISGTYAEKVLCKQSQVFPLPDNVSFAEGAALGVPYVTAYRALFHKAKAKAGETVLVHGASGGVGTAAIQFARAAGLTVIGTAGSEKARTQVVEQGALYALDHNDPEHFQQIMKLTSDKGVDVVIEMLANVNLAKDLDVMAMGGRIVIVGCRGSIEIEPRLAMNRETSILAMVVMNASEAERHSIHCAIAAGLEKGFLKPVIGSQLPLAEAPQAHHQIMESNHLGKIILLP